VIGGVIYPSVKVFLNSQKYTKAKHIRRNGSE
jgi:hypothetical protein